MAEGERRECNGYQCVPNVDIRGAGGKHVGVCVEFGYCVQGGALAADRVLCVYEPDGVYFFDGLEYSAGMALGLLHLGWVFGWDLWLDGILLPFIPRIKSNTDCS